MRKQTHYSIEFDIAKHLEELFFSIFISLIKQFINSTSQEQQQWQPDDVQYRHLAAARWPRA